MTSRSFKAKQTVEETLSTSSIIKQRDMPLGEEYYLKMYDATDKRWISNSISYTLLDPAGITEVKADDMAIKPMPHMYRIDGKPATSSTRGLIIHNGRIEFRR